jgi:putative peptide zinc metalloprotease protein
MSDLIDHLIVRAEIDGQVISSNLDALTGSYIEKGQEIVSVANGSKKKALALVDQTDAKHLQATVSKPTQLDVFGEFWKRHQGIVRQCEPRARDNVPHEAFSAANGGMLTVVPRAQVDSSPEKRGNTKLTSFQSDQWKLVEPRVLLTIEFNPTDSENLRSGQSGIAYLAVRNQSLGSYLADNFSRWVSAQIKRNHGL